MQVARCETNPEACSHRAMESDRMIDSSHIASSHRQPQSGSTGSGKMLAKSSSQDRALKVCVHQKPDTDCARHCISYVKPLRGRCTFQVPFLQS